MKMKLTNRLTDFIVNYFTMSSQLVPQADAERSIRDDVSFHGTNILILILAILIASLGLNTNSTAVIIGAMLISPLMGPIIGIGLGVGIHDFDLIKRALRNLLMAAGFSVLASTVYFLISPVSEGHSELLARTSPTIYDVLIGFVGGGAGILAIGSRSKGNVIPGVAIATALMPPLCTAGYGLATWQLNYFFGAFYLFLINSIYIAFATFIGCKLLGYKGADIVDNKRAMRVRRIVYIIAVLTMLPSIWLTYTMLRDNKFQMQAGNFVAHECIFPETQVVSDKAYTDKGQRYISITLIGRPLPLDSLETALESKLKFYNLEGTRQSCLDRQRAAGIIRRCESHLPDGAVDHHGTATADRFAPSRAQTFGVERRATRGARAQHRVSRRGRHIREPQCLHGCRNQHDRYGQRGSHPFLTAHHSRPAHPSERISRGSPQTERHRNRYHTCN